MRFSDDRTNIPSRSACVMGVTRLTKEQPAKFPKQIQKAILGRKYVMRIVFSAERVIRIQIQAWQAWISGVEQGARGSRRADCTEIAFGRGVATDCDNLTIAY